MELFFIYLGGSLALIASLGISTLTFALPEEILKISIIHVFAWPLSFPWALYILHQHKKNGEKLLEALQKEKSDLEKNIDEVIADNAKLLKVYEDLVDENGELVDKYFDKLKKTEGLK